MIYKRIYSFSVFDHCQNGDDVYYLDKELKICGKVNDLPVKTAMKMMSDAHIDTERFEYWIEEEEKENAEEL